MRRTDTPNPAIGQVPERPRPPLILAGHGTRVAAGVDAYRALGRRVAGLLPGVAVDPGFVELTEPPIADAIARALDNAASVVVVPLMIGTGGHVREDIPVAIAAGRARHPEATVAYTRHLGASAPMVVAARRRIDEARGEWASGETAIVFVGRGCSVADANADHVRLGRVLAEMSGYALVQPAFIQVTTPTLSDSLDAAYALGQRRLVVMPHFLFPGRLETWVHEQASAWASAHPDAEVRVAGVLGDCDEVASVVAQRYREGELQARTEPGSPAYLSGLLLTGRRVVAVGGGCVNRRRVPGLLDAGAEVTVVAPELHPALAALADAGRVTWVPRDYADDDLDGAWYVLAATDSPETNARIAADAEARHTFCVRADAAELGSAWTPATGTVAGVTIAALAHRDPKRSKRVRDELLTHLGGSE